MALGPQGPCLTPPLTQVGHSLTCSALQTCSQCDDVGIASFLLGFLEGDDVSGSRVKIGETLG